MPTELMFLLGASYVGVFIVGMIFGATLAAFQEDRARRSEKP